MILSHVLHNNRICDILISGNRIAQIADRIDAPNDTHLDCTGKAILPTFANIHTHAAMMFLRGIGGDKELFDWLQNDIWPREAKLTAEHIYPLSRFALLEMIKTGTTFFCDMYGNPQETVRAVQEMGLRTMLPYVGLDMFQEEQTHHRIENAKHFMEEPSPSPNIIKGLSCHAIYTCSEKLIRTFFDMSVQYNTFFHIHVSETQKEVDDCLAQHGCRPVELLHRWGVLSDKTILAHAVHLDEAEQDLVAATHATIAHCPTSNLKLGSGQMDFQKYLDKGLKITIGTDSVSSNNSLSMLSEMKLTALSAKSRAGSVLAANASDIFRAATQNGFQAFGINAGQIQEGFLADFMLVDLDNHFLLPNTDLVSNLIYAGDSSCITDVFCDGKQVMKNGHIANEEEIIADFKRVCRTLDQE